MKSLVLLALAVLPQFSYADCVQEYRDLAQNGSVETYASYGGLVTTSSVAATLIIATDGLILIPATTTANQMGDNSDRERAEYKKIVDVLNESSLNKSGGLHTLDLSQLFSERLDKEISVEQVVEVVNRLNQSEALCKPDTLTFSDFLIAIEQELE